MTYDNRSDKYLKEELRMKKHFYNNAILNNPESNKKWKLRLAKEIAELEKIIQNRLDS